MNKPKIRIGKGNCGACKQKHLKIIFVDYNNRASFKVCYKCWEQFVNMVEKEVMNFEVADQFGDLCENVSIG
jgi:hypothetical protein